MAQHDIVVIGGGHNGLTAAAYLAKAGLDVVLLEANDYLGGGVVTRELTQPGFRHDMYSAAHVLILDNPLIREDELGLIARYGLKYVFPDPTFSVVFRDDSYIAFYRDVQRTAETIARISPKDAENYVNFHAVANRLTPMLVEGMFTPPPPLGKWMSRLDRSEIGQEMIRTCMLSYLDVVNEWFENSAIRAALARWIAESMAAPEDGSTGTIPLTMIPAVHRGGIGFPVGGSGQLSEALATALRDMGGTVRTAAPVGRILFDGDRATGVVLASGERIEARRAVVADVNIRQVPRMVDHRFGDSWERKVNRIKPASFSTLSGHMALTEAPVFRAGPEVGQAGIVEVAMPMTELRQAFDGLKYGVPACKIPTISAPSVWDPTRAPAGRHTLYLIGFAPPRLDKDDWATRKEEFFGQVFDTFCDLTVNMSHDKVLGQRIDSPADVERLNSSWPGGDGEHFGAQLFQLMSYRPLPNMGYRLPAESLYLVGPSTHPGAGVTGGARAGVQAIMKDLGIDFATAIASR
jgi:phytoene dehydrogenase-like protein